MPIASNGFIAATRRNPGAAAKRPSRGTWSSALGHHGDQHVQRLLGDPVDLLDVEQRTLTERPHQRAVDEHVGRVALAEDAGGIEVADQPGRRQFGVALDELEPWPVSAAMDRSRVDLPVPGGPSNDVTVGERGCDDQFDLSSARPPARSDRREPRSPGDDGREGQRGTVVGDC